MSTLRNTIRIFELLKNVAIFCIYFMYWTSSISPHSKVKSIEFDSVFHWLFESSSVEMALEFSECSFLVLWMFHSFYLSLALSLSLENLKQNNYAQSKWNKIQVILATWLVIWGFIVFSIGTLLAHDGCWCYFIVCAKLNSHRWIKWWMVLNSHFSALLMRWNFICQLTYRLCDNCKFCYSFDRKFGFQNGFESFAHWNAIYVAMVNQMVT